MTKKSGTKKNYAYYLPTNDSKRVIWLNNFSAKLKINYATLLNVLAATITQTVDDAADFQAMINLIDAYKKYLHNLIIYKDHLKAGNKAGTPLGTIAAPPALPTFSSTLTDDIFGRITKLVQILKLNTNYNDNIGEDLGIIGADTPHFVGLPSERLVLKPIFKYKLEAGGHPLLHWHKNHMHAVYMLVDRGDGKGFVFLGVFTKAKYLDSFALPALGAAALWKYKGIYYENDAITGEWSDELTIPVKGV